MKKKGSVHSGGILSSIEGMSCLQQENQALDYDNSDLAPQLQYVSPSADITAPSQQELDLLFGPLYDEFFNAGGGLCCTTIRVRDPCHPDKVYHLKNALYGLKKLREPGLQIHNAHEVSLSIRPGGTFMKRHPEECFDLIKNMTAHHNDWDTSAQKSESSSSITSSSDLEIVALKAEMVEINKNLMKVLQINHQVKAVTPSCETCGGPYSYNDCPAIKMMENASELSHLNFDYINLLSKKDIVIGLPKLKYVKDQLCSSCELSKAKRISFKSKVVPSSKGRLNLLNMDLCGPMRVASINGKKYNSGDCR
uniref:Ribonuclease H-like domain-containing protein n=1 Tax=Tanacetum cinerariifolium TaxID=118510 RepID=A0A699HA15_TANCI|nr:ribonuclease H-like domain-containing protein [Tanacetum cinerariifolium]